MTKYYLTDKGMDVGVVFPNEQEMIEYLENRIKEFGGDIENYGYRKEVTEVSFGSFGTLIYIK